MTGATPSPELDRLLTAGAEHMRTRQFDAARTAFERATHLAPQSPAAWRGFANALLALGERERSGAAHLRALQASANDPDLAAAGKAVAAGRLQEAYPVLRDRLSAEPSDIAALRIMADLAIRMGRPLDGTRMLIRAVELAPDFDGARQALYQAFLQVPRADALAEVDQQLTRQPGHFGFLNLKAGLLDRSSDYEGAVAIYRAMLAIRPDDALVWTSLGNVLHTLGRIDDGIDAYRRSTTLQPERGDAWWSLANLKTFRFSDEDVAELRRLLDRPDLDDGDRLHIEFALGKALEDRRDYGDSFVHYAAGNRIRRALVPYNPAYMSDQQRRAAKLFTPAFFAARAKAGDSAPDPIFVVSLPRSGSTLVEQILASHPAIEGTMELNDIPRIVRQLDLPSGRYPEALANIPDAELAALGAEYLRSTQLQRKSDKPRFVDKLPVNFMHVGLIRAILPNARIVDVRRHPLSCGWSCFKQHFARGYDFGYDLAEIGGYYRTYVEFMALWDRALPGHVHHVRYEDLVEDTESEVRRLLDYLGLPFDEACLRFHETKRAVRTPSAEQVRQPIFRQGLDQWQHYEAWLGPMKDALGDVLTAYPDVPETIR